MDNGANSISFDLKNSEFHSLKITQEASFENFVSQFQPYSPKLLCVIDGTILHYYDKSGPFPSNLRFDYKQRRSILTEYYFRDIHTDILYCVFGYDSAKLFYPRLDSVDSSSSIIKFPSLLTPSPLLTAPTTKSHILPPLKIPLFRELIPHLKSSPIIIIDNNVKLTFLNPNYPVEVNTFYPS